MFIKLKFVICFNAAYKLQWRNYMAYSESEVFEESLKYFKGDGLAADVIKKYLLQNQEKEFLEKSPDQMHRRLAKEFARIEKTYPNPLSEDEIYELLKDFKYLVAQGSPMSAIGNEHQFQSLSNCFVIDQPEDSYGGILLADQEQVQLMKRRGGVGFDISKIRPRGMTTSNAAKTTAGIGVFMERFSNSTREVAQDGRRGALMLTIDCRHPEIDTFINIKRDLKKVTGANISVRFTDDFLQAVEAGREFDLRWPVDALLEDAKVIRTVDAKSIWDLFVDSAWASAEPGALFWDTVTRNTPADIYADNGFSSISTNPCGEIVLCPYDSCRLMALNLASFVTDPFTPNAKFDEQLFAKVARKSQRLMDDLVDLEIEAIDKIRDKITNDTQPLHVKRVEIDLWDKVREKASAARRTGLGVTALGDALAMLGLRYGSDESIRRTENIYMTMAIAAHTESCVLAAERGAFSIFDYEKEKDHEYMKKIMNHCDSNTRELWKRYGRRNIALTTTAPTGSVSCLTQTTSGIEPAFLLSYKRRRKIVVDDQKADFVDAMGDRWQEYDVYHHNYKKWMDITSKSDVKDSPYYLSTSNDVDWLASVQIQAVAQRWIDHSISKTCNLPNSASKELISEAYLNAWKSGCKGFTVYRDGCRTGVLVEQDDEKAEAKVVTDRSVDKRDKELPCDIHHVNVKGESWLVLVGLKDGSPYEIFCGVAGNIEVSKKIKHGFIIKNGKKDGVATYNLKVPFGDDEILFKDIVNLFDNPTQSALTRTLSLTLRHKIPMNFIVEQIQKSKEVDMFSFSKCLARVLKAYIPDGTKSAGDKICPSCSSDSLIYMEGCVSCVSCGTSKCS
jgi:ribonucleoside-diphosphate reductase alpha chain